MAGEDEEPKKDAAEDADAERARLRTGTAELPDEEEDSDDDPHKRDDTPAPPATELPEGVQKEVLKPGEGHMKPPLGSDVQVHYVGTLESDGTQFDSSRDRGKPLGFTLGKGQVIKGWDLGVASMKKGETARFTLAPNYAYGEAGSPPKIPGDATLVFEVELLDWTEKEDLLGDGGCLKTVLEEGTNIWRKPKEPKENEVLISVKATSESGVVIEDRPSIDYTLGSGVLGPLSTVVDKALAGMAKEGKVILTCAKDYVYKDSSHGEVTVDLLLEEIYAVNDVSFAKDKSILKKTIREGQGYETPVDQDAVTLKVEAALDSAGNSLPGFTATELSFEAFNGDVCDVIEQASSDMKKGERALVTCVRQALPKVVDKRLGISELKVDQVCLRLELVDFVKAKDCWSMSTEEKIELAFRRKEQGSKLFIAKRFELALEKYKKIGDAITNHDGFPKDLRTKAAEVKKVAELNKAAVFLKLGNWEGAAESCDTVLQDDPDNVKALFRRGKARHERLDHLGSQADLKRVLDLDSSNSEAKVLLQRVQWAQKQVDKAAKATYAKMMSGMGTMGPRKTAAPDPIFDESETEDDDEEEEDQEAQGAKNEAAAMAKLGAAVGLTAKDVQK